ncbi:head-to-tail adaptor [Arthrobacter phage Kepler]|uniref:Head-to-tail adaptor n=8 Tax=Coralvirus TaxID=2733171 RepID=A0A5J6TQL6_9CAUD|nr:head-to-tail adaptor [Arthrobacter phage Coral]YP_009815838.1 head-to-tail adaptor [Arthrobacter phage Kepler]AYN57584.1 head-to-tail adaptor [Arthrobacter phage Cote]AYN57659.1 head-to-tail adaptor [Arthrobacter phage Daob]AYN58418.1 head-to-tail adaptor [Arthrobacter phage Lunar]AYN58560.1 head-to-tail adaptor [Arthrobacter phage Melons]AYN58766.1 head-to-tail adaptor [Arthrobacter phage Polka]QFG13065.1 head-to-tail adaptor [Arthrobacter phage Amelia]
MTTEIIEPAVDAFRLPAFVTAEEFSTWTNGKVAAADPRVEPLLKGASAGLRRYAGWHIAPVLEETLVGDGPGGRLLSLPTGRLVSVVSVDNGGTVVDLADVDPSLRLGMLELRSGWWSSRFGAVSVRVRHGFDLADVEDVRQIVKQVTANALASPMGATREQAGTVSISWATTAPGVAGGLSLLQRDLEVLAPFKI